jgi:hypothetical protein
MADKKINGQIQALQKKVEELEEQQAMSVHLTMGVLRTITQSLHVQEGLAEDWRSFLKSSGLAQPEGKIDTTQQ